MPTVSWPAFDQRELVGRAGVGGRRRRGGGLGRRTSRPSRRRSRRRRRRRRAGRSRAGGGGGPRRRPFRSGERRDANRRSGWTRPVAAPARRPRAPAAATARGELVRRVGRAGRASSRCSEVAGRSVPQWIGTAIRGRSSAAASRRPLRIEVARPERRAPAPDRQQRDVDRRPRSAIPSNRSVSPAKYTAAAVDDVAERVGRRPDAEPVRRRGRRATASTSTPADLGRLAGGELAHVREPAAAEHRARAARDHQRRAAAGAGAATAGRGGRGAGARSARRRGRAWPPAPAAGRGARRCASRGRSSGSVSSRAPPTSISAVAWPTQTTRLIPRGARRAGRARLRVVAEPGVHRRGLDHRARRGDEPVEALGRRERRDRPGLPGRPPRSARTRRGGRGRRRGRRRARARAARASSSATRAARKRRGRQNSTTPALTHSPRSTRGTTRRIAYWNGLGGTARLLGLVGERRAGPRAAGAGTPT